MVLAAAASLAGPGIAPAAGRGPIKTGFIAPFTGGRAQAGEDMLSGFVLVVPVPLAPLAFAAWRSSANEL